MSFPIDAIRERFPALALRDESRARVYLDNPAGTQVPQTVADAVADCLIHANANLGGCFESSRRADYVADSAHAAMAEFLGAASAEEIVIGPSMTTLTFHLSRSICRDLRPGDEIVVTRIDHEGNVAPWLELAEDKGLVVRWLSFDENSWQIEPAALDKLLSERTRLVAINYSSNLLGSVNDVKTLAAKARAAGALVYVDAVQLAPHRAIDVQTLGCDFLACSSYKFFGPHLGILWGRKELLESMHAYKCRCVGEALPGKFETGTPQIELLAGLSASVDYFGWLGEAAGSAGARREKIVAGYAAMQRYEETLARRLIGGLEGMPGIRIFGITDPARLSDRVPTVSFRHTKTDPRQIARSLGEQGIFVWNGHNYALEVVRQLGVPEHEGMLRIGIAHYNTLAEIDQTLDAVSAAVDA